MKFYLFMIVACVANFGIFSCQSKSKRDLANQPLLRRDSAPIYPNVNSSSEIRELLSEPVLMDLRFGMTELEVASMLQQFSIQNRVSVKLMDKRQIYVYALNLENISIPMSIGYSLDENRHVSLYSLSTIDNNYGKIEIFKEIKNFFFTKYGASCYEHRWHGKKIPEFFEERLEWKTDKKRIELFFSQKIDEYDQIVGNIFIGFNNSMTCSSNGDLMEHISDDLNKSGEDEYLKRKFGIPSKSEFDKTKSDF